MVSLGGTFLLSTDRRYRNETLKSAIALLMCLAVLLPLLPGESLSEESELSEFRVDEKEDLSRLPFAVEDYLVYYGSSSVIFHFSKKLVDKYSVDELINMSRRAGYMVSMEGFEAGYSAQSDGTLRVELANMKIRSGEQMLNAWIFEDRSRLTSEENRCLDKVIQVMKGLMQKYPEGSLELETAIYDYICDHVSYRNYPSESGKREACTSACNAFLYGWGNCQAYSDLFRLMATIGGFSTGLMSGKANNEAHMWNWIGTWFDGEYRVYMVDVTYGDKDGQRKTDHFYLNFGLDRVDDHTWYKELFMGDEFERYTNDSCTYYNGKTGFTAGTMADAARLCADLVKRGQRKFDLLVFQRGIWENEIESALNKSLPKRDWYFSCFSHDVGVTISFWR